uniref:hydroxymethylbilane synthase n=1 Tax=Magallana gigas TaxID=29159 RepID=K1QBP9_MAGGI
MVQAHLVGQFLKEKYPLLEIVFVPISTLGDRVKHGAWDDEARGVFVKELEQALLDHQADIAVHSLKDVPFQLPKGLHLCSFLEREQPGDVVLTKSGDGLKKLPKGAIVGTSSMRRSVFLKKKYPHLLFRSIRGSVETRIKKMEVEKFDAIILAKAALLRLKLNLQGEDLSFDALPPAPSQGIIAIENRCTDRKINALLRSINDRTSHFCARAERKAMHLLGAGCRKPFSAHATLDGEVMRLNLAIADRSLTKIKKSTAYGEKVCQLSDCDKLASMAVKKLRKTFFF